jgi:hypothetical protein
MKREDIIRMAREAGWSGIYSKPLMSIAMQEDDFLRFAALVAAEKEQQMIRDGWRQCAEGQRTTQHCGLLDAAVKDEREACAKVCEKQIKSYLSKQYTTDPLGGLRERFAAEQCAAAIRARGEV